MYQVGLFLFFTACFVLTLFLIYHGLKLIRKADKAFKQTTADVKKKVNDAALATDTFISCPKCHARLRVPKGKGAINVTCPKCKYRFQHNSGALRNDLDLYRPGGPLRMKPVRHPYGSTIERSREAMLNELALMCAESFDWYYGWKGNIIKTIDDYALFQEYGGPYTKDVTYIDIKFAPTELICRECLVFPEYPSRKPLIHDSTKTYDSFLSTANDRRIHSDAARSKDQGAPKARFHVPVYLTLNNDELLLLSRMTYTKLIDTHPMAFMHDGRLYLHGQKAATGSSFQ
ncbi:MAG: zinc-ribbon domain-containing protein [Clostridiales bacterium]|nr:zinc-ribbon domain-containing protein [Clostridiales bacterium]